MMSADLHLNCDGKRGMSLDGQTHSEGPRRLSWVSLSISDKPGNEVTVYSDNPAELRRIASKATQLAEWLEGQSPLARQLKASIELEAVKHAP